MTAKRAPSAACRPGHVEPEGPPGERRHRRRDRQGGLALVVVLWLVVVLALQLAILNASVRDGLELAENDAGAARGRALMHAAIELAASRMRTRDAEDRWQPDSGSHTVSLDGASVHIAISSDNGRLDLNACDAVFLEGLLRVIGVGDRAAGQLASRIVRARGQPFADAGGDRPRPSRDARDGPVETGRPFVDVDDLLRIKGVDAELLRNLRPHVTLYTGVGTVNPLLATPEVLRALPGVSARVAEEALRLRAQGGEAALGLPTLLAPARAYLDSTKGPAYRIAVRIDAPRQLALGGGEAAILPGLDADAPYRVLMWRFQLGRITSEGSGS